MQDRRQHFFNLTMLILLWSIGSIRISYAQTFTQMNWDEMRIDSVLPYYTEVIPLETDYRFHDYSVKVLYPEWGELSSKEQKVVDAFAEQIADTLILHHNIGISRGEGMLDLWFIPIIKEKGHYKKLLNGKIEITAHSKQPSKRRMATQNLRWKANSALANGKWVKISIQEDGLYHLTNAQIQSMGFSRPENICVMGYGGHLQKELIDADNDWDDLDTVSVLPVADGYVFHANGLLDWRAGQHYINHYANKAYYFVTEANAITRSFPQEGTPMPAHPEYISSVTNYFAYDPQGYSWYQGGRTFFENYDYFSGNSRTYTLNLPTYVASAKATLSVAFSAGDTDATKITPTLNGTSLSTFSIPKLTDSYSSAVLKKQEYPVKNLQESNTLKIVSTANHHARLNYFEITYQSTLKIDYQKPCIQFHYKNASSSTVLNIEYAAGQNPQLWRVGDQRKPTAALQGVYKDSTDAQGSLHHYYQVPLTIDNTEQTYLVFDANAYTGYQQPQIENSVSNQNLHAFHSLDMVIITPANGLYDAEAERLAAAHRQYDNLRVAVVRADQIYNEFSSGTPDATAYRRFMKMLYDRGMSTNSQPRYLLLFGDGVWDNRMVTAECRNFDPNNYLLTFESENSTSDILCYVMEDYFGLLDDGEGSKLTSDKTDLGIGRFPVSTLTEATTLVDKTITYIENKNGGTWKNVVCFLGDDGDNNEHLRYADNVAQAVAKNHPELELRKIMWDAYKREGDAAGYRYPTVTEAIYKQMNEGALMMNYTGHGATYTLSHEHVLTLEDFKAFNTPKCPLWVTAACDIMPFDGLKENIGETAVLHASGSAIAFYGTTRTVYAYNNLILNQAFCNSVFEKDEFGRANTIGDAVRLSKVKIITEGSELGNLQNKLHYVLLGDPALKIGNHQHQLVIDSINQYAVTNLPEDYMIHAGGKMNIKGHVVDATKQPVTNYYGTLQAKLFDSESNITCLNNAKSSSTFEYKVYDKILYAGRDSITNGNFNIVCPVPLDIKYSNERGRLVLFGMDLQNSRETNGFNESFRVGGTEPALTDTVGPVILSYLDNEDFQDGGTVGTTPYFMATLRDESGINTCGNGIGHNLELIIDNKAAYTFNLDSYYSSLFGNYQQGTVNFSIPELSEGQHTLLFRAWDIMNNSSTESYTFYADPSKSINVTRLIVSKSPATTSTDFIIQYDRPGSLCNYTIEVFDFSGRFMWYASGSSSNESGQIIVPWNLTSGGGMPLSSGIYLYRAKISCGNAETVTKAQKIIINRRQ